MPSQINNSQSSYFGKLKNLNRVIPGMGLFLKFFLGTWIIILLVILLTVAWGYIYHIEPTNKDFEKLGFEFLKIHSETMAELYESSNPSVLQYMFKPGSAMLYDHEGKTLIKELKEFLPTPEDIYQHRRKRRPGSAAWNRPELIKFVKQVATSDIPLTLETKKSIYMARSIVAKSGKKYVAVSRFPLKMFNRHRRILRVFAKLFPFILFVSAFICFLFSRQVVKPVLDIQKAGQIFSNGNLKARVDERHVNRMDELGFLSSSFNSMATKIESMVLSQKRLQSDISHELRSPLARMQVAAEILRKKIATKDVKSLDRIELEVSRMNELIGNILELSRVDSILTSLKVCEFNITEMISEIALDANYEAKKTKKKVIFEYKEKLEIVGNKEVLARAFENVIRNSLKYTKPDSEVAITQLFCEVGSIAKFEITDNGSGVDEENLPLIFQPFFRCEEARDRNSGGTGLGLAIAKRAIDRHLGEIRAENISSGGLRIIIELPLNEFKL